MDIRHRLPPLTAIKAFEAAGRHGNFSKAAKELNVTPGAVSRQIKVLEEFLGLSLFVRRHGQAQITHHGQIYLKSVQEALNKLEVSTQEILVQSAEQPLHIWGSRYFIHSWLMPRLHSFFERHPEQDIRITSLVSSNPMPTEVDVGIRFGNGVWSGIRSHALIGLHLTPVCSPDYLNNNSPLETAEDLADHALIQNIVGSDHWRQWYQATGAPPVALRRRIVCTSADIAYSAALEGQGVALGRKGFIERDLKAGRLVTPITFTFKAEGSFFLTYHDRDHLPSRLLKFRRWILDELHDSPVR